MHWIALRPNHNNVTAGDAAGDAANDAALADVWVAWTWWALGFTPLVAQVQDALVLEVSGSARLFGGQQTLLRQLFESNKAPGPAEHAQGATSLIATARLWSGQTQASPDTLPVQALMAARAHAPTLARLGVRTWGQLRALPRGGLVRRFGAGLLAALDQAYGQRSEVYPWLTLPEVFDAPLELVAAVDSAPALLFGARRLLAQLLVWLRARQRGVLALELLWDLDARRSNTQHVDAHHTGGQQGRLELRTAQATQDMQHLQRLLGEQLARVTLPAPVLHLRMRTLQTQALIGESRSLLPEDVRPGDNLHQMLERLRARLGAQQVLCVQPLADHRPECMQRWQPWSTEPLHGNAQRIAPENIAACAQPASMNGLFPSWLLPVPMPLRMHLQEPWYEGALTLLAGPQRLEAGWLEGEPALRDYFVARSEKAGLVWIFRERLPGAEHSAQTPLRWYLHGLFA